MLPRVILATQVRPFVDGAVVIDMKRKRFAYRGQVMALRGYSFEVAVCFLARMPRLTSRDDLVDHLYGDDPDGGPECIRECIDVPLMRARRLFDFLDLALANEYGRGWRVVEAQRREIAA